MKIASCILAYAIAALIMRCIATKYMQFHTSHQRNGLDILRGVLAFCVFAGHSVLMSNTLDDKPWWPPQSKDIQVNILAGLAVDCFFVITGFLFSNNRKTIQFSILSFYYRRFLRIYPAYAVMSLLLCIFYAIIGKFNISLFNLFILATTRVNVDYQELNPALYFHIWSLKLEVYFYLVLPLIYIFSRKLNSYAYLIVMGLLIGFVDIRFIFILVGYAYGGNKEWINNRFKLEQMRIPLILSSLSLFMILDFYYFEMNRYLLGFIRIIFSLFIVAIFLDLKVGRRFLPLCTIGDMSYSLYLCHGLSLVISYNLALQFNPSIIDSNIFILFSVPMLVLLTVVIFRFSEYYYFRSSQ